MIRWSQMPRRLDRELVFCFASLGKVETARRRPI